MLSSFDERGRRRPAAPRREPRLWVAVVDIAACWAGVGWNGDPIVVARAAAAGALVAAAVVWCAGLDR
jgi:hypothetical protein